MHMDATTIRRLYEDGEGERVEWKQEFAKDKICRTICAFSNDLANIGKPGVIFIGRRDDGACAGLTVDDALLNKIVEIRSEGKVVPRPIMQVVGIEIDKCDMAVIVVQPSDTPPVYYEGRIYVRVGPSTREATREEERRLFEKRQAKFFDIAPIREASLDDLDLLYLREEYIPSAVSREVLLENDRSLEHQLAALHLLTPDGIPTVLGMLVGGKNPRDALPGAYVQFLRVDGEDITDPIRDQEEIGGQLREVLQRVNDKLQAHNTIATELTGEITEIQRPDYPLVALQELIDNALMHRDYHSSNAPVRVTWFNDRIEIHNPGGPFGRVTEANFGQPNATDYRNPNLAAAMKHLGYVQRFGLGIPLSRRRLAENHNPEPLFEAKADENYVLVTVRRRR
jgi:ATP-dependent DNA helicase RecG